MNKKIIFIIFFIVIIIVVIAMISIIKNKENRITQNSLNSNTQEKSNVIQSTSSTNDINNTIRGKENMKLYIKVNDRILTATLENNSSTDALIEKLEQNDITIDMEDYANFEKVGSLGFSLPRNDKQITTTAGDIILYQGNSITIYYDTNNWNFTKLGHIDNITQKELKEILGTRDVTVTFSLKQ